MNGDEDFDSLKVGSTDTVAIESYYDDWASTYDQELKEWHYSAPAEAADQLASHLSNVSNVLDVGCGTGLFAKALSSKCKCAITGIDISTASLKKARHLDIYNDLLRCDLQKPPLPFDTSQFDAVASVGVMTYVAQPRALLTDLCRIVKPSGHLLFTHRDDRWKEQGFDALMKELDVTGVWEILDISDPRPYLPRNAEFGDKIKVVFAFCRVC